MTCSGILRSRSISFRIHFGAQELTQFVEQRPAPVGDERVRVGVRIDQAEPEVSEEQVPDERRVLPLALSRIFRDPAGFVFADVGSSDGACGLIGHAYVFRFPVKSLG